MMKTKRRYAPVLAGLALCLGAISVGSGRAQAAVFSVPELDRLGILEPAQYVYGGYNYCWFPNGWQGPGWYVCNYGPWVRGRWWGGPAGWRGWYYRGGPRPWRGGPGPGWHGGHGPGWGGHGHWR